MQLVDLGDIIGIFDDGVDVRTIVVFEVISPHVCSLEVCCIGEIDTPIFHIRLLNIDHIALHVVVRWGLSHWRLLRFEWRRSYECYIIQIRVILLILLSILWVRAKLLRVSVVWLYCILHVIAIIVHLGTNRVVFTIILR